MLLRGPYFPRHEENRMKNEGDVVLARQLFYEKPSKNLNFLLRKRFSWMNKYINPETDVGLEVGSGIGLSKHFIKAKSFLLTDYADLEWLDIKNIDACHTPFEDEQFDFVVASAMIHHLPNPIMFFEEIYRILKPGGYLLVAEVNCSLFMRFILHLMHHEGYSFDVDVFDRTAVLCNPNNLWSANNAIPNLLFDNIERFKKEIHYFRIVHTRFTEFSIFLNSGGVTAKTFYVPLPYFALKFLNFFDDILVWTFPQTFALGRQIVLQK